MEALIDADILVYECAFAGQSKEEDGHVTVHSFQYVADILDEKVEQIKRATGADKATLYLSGKRNFRTDIAKAKPYKGTRSTEKPWHYKNLRPYICSLPNHILTDGIEADDAMCIEQTKRLAQKDTIICSRDKDLRICQGYQYGWEHGEQPEFFPQWVDRCGKIELLDLGYAKEIKGTGLAFFYSQLITGDSVDNIPGLPRGGPVLAYGLLKDCLSELEMYNAVYNAYQEWGAKKGYTADEVYEYFKEQAQLLWMVQELDDDGQPVMWEAPIDNIGIRNVRTLD